jgi:hypothetical protein
LALLNEIYGGGYNYLDQSIIQSALTDGDIEQWAANYAYGLFIADGEIEQSFDQNSVSDYGEVMQLYFPTF